MVWPMVWGLANEGVAIEERAWAYGLGTFLYLPYEKNVSHPALVWPGRLVCTDVHAR